MKFKTREDVLKDPKTHENVVAVISYLDSLVKYGGYVCEYYFSKERRFRFDFAWPNKMIYLEYDGGIFCGKKGRGRHVRPFGYHEDCNKFNEASLLGWKGMRMTVLHLKDPYEFFRCFKRLFHV